MLRGHAIYEGVYLLGTSIARPLIAKRQIAAAKKFGAYAVSLDHFLFQLNHVKQHRLQIF